MMIAVPIDRAALNGQSRLVESQDGHLQAAHFANGAWRYGSGTPVGKTIVNYYKRVPPI